MADRLHARIPARTGALIVVALVAVWAAAGAAAAAPAAASTVTLTVSPSPATVLYGQTVTMSGTVADTSDGVIEGLQVDVTVDGVVVTSPLTDATGAFATTFTPTAGGSLVATVVSDAGVSPAVVLAVQPRLAFVTLSTVPFGTSKLRIRTNPSSYTGVVTATVWHHSRRVAAIKGKVVDGRLVLRVPTAGVGDFSVHLGFAAAGGLAQRSIRHRVAVAGPRIAVGTHGAAVTALLKRLAWLRFHIPGVSSTLGLYAADSIVAFQKAYGLPRTYVFDADDWKKIDRAKKLKPRKTTPSPHIEIDKTRQILSVVKNGKTYGIIPVSTGATGNTPVGTFHILSKAPQTGTWLGPGILYRTMTFYRNFAIHGYDPCPAYPASHGCVREPMWFADWTYNQSYVGEEVDVYP